jgi:hypothetical protein
MDIASRTTRRTTVRNAFPLVGRLVAVTVTAALAASLLGTAARPASRPAGTRIVGDTAEARQAVTWALARYGTAGLASLPSLEIVLHPSDAGCDGNLGYYRDGRVDLCVAEASEPYARKFALHELAHAWTAAHLDAGTQARFLELRGLDRWNTPGDAWKERGIEQAAEIIAWGLGEGEIRPLLPEPATTDELVAAFVLLTGERPIASA